MNKKYIYFTLVSFIIGFMLFVQFNTTQNPDMRETKDIWEVRNDLAEAQKKHSELLTQIEQAKIVAEQYEDGDTQFAQQTLEETLYSLEKIAGSEPINGPGFHIVIEPSFDVIQFGYELQSIPPMLLTQLVNELNRNGAKYIEIAGERVTFTTAIRDINGETKVNGKALAKSYADMKVITASTDQAQKLYNYLLSSSLMDEFFIDNLSLQVSAVENDVNLDATIEQLKPIYMRLNE